MVAYSFLYALSSSLSGGLYDLLFPYTWSNLRGVENFQLVVFLQFD